MEIQTTLSRTNSFSELLQIAERSEPHLTFLGREYVSVSGYEGTLHIDALAARTLELLKQLNYEFSEAERESGRRLAGRIDNIYDDMDKRLDNCHCITTVIYTFREIFNFLSHRLIYGGELSTRQKWQGYHCCEPNNDFKYYTRSQFQLRFGVSPEEAEARGDCIYKKDNPQRWHISSQRVTDPIPRPRVNSVYLPIDRVGVTLGQTF